MNFSPDMSFGSAARAYWLTKVSVASSTAASVSRISVGMILTCSGEGYWNAFIPLSIGRMKPPVMPKQWKIGSGLKNTQAGSSSMWAAIWAALASRLAWVRITPRGAPKLPEVNRITAGSSGLVAARNRRGASEAARA